MLNRFQRSLPTPRLTFATRYTNALSSEKNCALWNDAPVHNKWHLQLSRAAASVVPFPVASIAANGR